MILADWNVLGILPGEQVNYKAGPPGADIVTLDWTEEISIFSPDLTVLVRAIKPQ